MKYAILAIASLFVFASCGDNSADKNAAKDAPMHGEQGNANDPNAVLDPVCKMVKTDAWTLSSTTHGQEFYFCSELCKEQFDANPHKFMPDHQH